MSPTSASSPKKERRRSRRSRLLPKYEIKARVRKMDSPSTEYFLVDNLSEGGLCIVAQKASRLSIKEGDSLEILVFRKNLSLRVIARVMGMAIRDSSDEVKAEKEKYRAQIVGIDERSKQALGVFLNELEKSQTLVQK